MKFISTGKYPGITEDKKSAGKEGENEMKKIAILGVFAIAFALTANVAFASINFGNSCCFPHRQSCCPEVNVNTSNAANIVNNITSKARTGLNTILGKGNATISTGDAGAVSGADSTANTNVITVAKPTLGKVNVNTSNVAGVINSVSATAGTGKNVINMCECGTKVRCGGFHWSPCHDSCPCPTASITSGDAGATSGATTVVNSNIITVQ